MQVKKRLKPTPAALVVLILLLILIVWAVWQFLFPHGYESPGPLTLAQAQSHCPIALPASAVNIRIATYSHAVQFVQYVRFEAPVADCSAHAKSLLPGAAESRFDASAAGFGPPFNPGAFRDLTPFDWRGIKNGVQYGTGGPSEPCIRIDLDRGVFYYQMTD